MGTGLNIRKDLTVIIATSLDDGPAVCRSDGVPMHRTAPHAPHRPPCPAPHPMHRTAPHAPQPMHLAQSCQLFLSDFPLHDMGREFVLLAEQRSAEAELKVRTGCGKFSALCLSK